jgi:hypothetical protein
MDNLAKKSPNPNYRTAPCIGDSFGYVYIIVPHYTFFQITAVTSPVVASINEAYHCITYR